MYYNITIRLDRPSSLIAPTCSPRSILYQPLLASWNFPATLFMMTNTQNRSKEQKEQPASSPISAAEQLTKDDCTKLCSYLNQNQGALVYAMAYQAACNFHTKINQIQNSHLVEMDSHGYTISFQLLTTDKSSNPKEIQWLVTFPHPMSSLSDIQTYFIQLHSSLLSPKISWLFTDWRMRIIVPTVTCLGYITHILGVDAFVQRIENMENEVFQFLLQKSFGSAIYLGNAIRISWYFAIITHTLEAIYVAHICLSVLKLKFTATLSWFYLTCLVGFPSTVRVLALSHYENNKSL